MSVDVDKEDVENSWYGVLSFFFVCLLELLPWLLSFSPQQSKYSQTQGQPELQEGAVLISR